MFLGLYTNIRLAFGISWIILFATEIGSNKNSSGIGYYIKNAQGLGRIEHVFAGVIFLGVTAFILDQVARAWLKKKIV